MLVAQITDLHLGFSGDRDDEPNLLRTRAVLDRIVRLDRRPDLLLVTGDVTEHGDAASYARATALLADLPFPAYVIPGNHDERHAIAAAFGFGGGAVQYAIDAGPLRVLMLDTFEPGWLGGYYDEVRAAWLRAALDEQPDRPTLLALHHPPFDCGIDWWAADERQPWVRRLVAAVAGRGNVVGMIAGHVHRAMAGRCGGVPVQVCASVAPGLALTLAPFDPDRPDGRPMIIDTLPAYAVHWWTGAGLVSHLATVGDEAVIVPYNEIMQPTVRQMRAERERRD